MIEDKIAYLKGLAGWCSEEKMNRLYTLVKECDREDSEPLIIELGIFAGRSLFPMALACQDLGKGGVFGIDAWSNEAATQGTNHPANDEYWSKINLENILLAYQTSIGHLALEKYIQTLRGKTIDFIDMFENDSIDIIHFDSSHNPETVIPELDGYVPKIKKGGFLIADDYLWPEVREAYDKIPSYGFEIYENYNEWVIFRKIK